MGEEGLDALLITAPGNYRYFTGHRTSFWAIRDRLRLCVICRDGEPTLLLTPLEDEWARACSWITDIRHHNWEAFATWSCRERGIEEVAASLKGLGLSGKRIGMELGLDQRLGLTYRDGEYLIKEFPAEIVDASDMLWRIRLIKSSHEIDALLKSTQILDDAFDDTWNAAGEGVRESHLCQIMADSMRKRGAEDMSFMFVQSDAGENEVAFRDPIPRKLDHGDIIYIDSGSIYKGYKSDYCRMRAIGAASDRQRDGYARIYRVLDASIRAVGPGGTVGDIVRATDQAMEREGFGSSKLTVRYGHSIGIEMPEPPSIAAPIGNVRIEQGMVLCLEPGALVEGRYYQLEEMVVVTSDGYKLLSKPAEPELQICG